MKEQNWPYLAGLIDGEGCITAWKYWLVWKLGDKRHFCNPYWQFSARVSITNTSLVLMKWLVSHYGGGFICKREATDKHKASFEWRPKGQKNMKLLLLAILPYLVIKREQAILLLEYIELGTNPDQRALIVEKLQILNRKGSVETDTLNGDEPKIQSELS